MPEQPANANTEQTPDHSIKTPEDIKELKLSLQQTRTAVLVRATAKSISERFADETDFNTIGDLQNCLAGAQNEINTTASLINDMPPPSGQWP